MEFLYVFRSIDNSALGHCKISCIGFEFVYTVHGSVNGLSPTCIIIHVMLWEIKIWFWNLLFVYDPLQAFGFEGDVRKQEDASRVVESTFNSLGSLDILVNAAAGNFLVSAEDLSPNGFRTGFICMQLLLYDVSYLILVHSDPAQIFIRWSILDYVFVGYSWVVIHLHQLTYES